ncbi:MAG: UDP-N-acetylmuramate--L-alanine ligase [Candidatus Brocadiae bacterium]|nr:UDP-N-acetylmuramate--L-alanine ligase [Candidatus Brocadiia bacterium]
MDIKNFKYAHFIGIEGIGMSAAADIIMDSGILVSGSDLNPGRMSLGLAKKGATIYKGHNKENIQNSVDIVVISAAIKEENPELQEARKQNKLVWKYSDLLGYLIAQKRGISVAGTHGKSTTSGMVSYMLHIAGLDPSFVVGAVLRQFDSNAHSGKGDFFVAEACEYDRSFLKLISEIAIITNIEADHLDYYNDLKEIFEAFYKFSSLLPNKGLLVVEKTVSSYFAAGLACQVQSYSISEEADWQALDIQRKNGKYSFRVVFRGEDKGWFQTSLYGKHNVANSLAAIAVGYHLGIPKEVLQNAIAKYQGVKRRFEILAQDPVTIIDDYAHHPTEIKAALSAMRDYKQNQKVWAVFQPHQASRTLHLLNDFASAFSAADEVIVADIYYARDSMEIRQKINSAVLVEKLNQNGTKARHIGGGLQEIEDFLKKNLQPGDSVITMGAGNICQVSQALSCADIFSENKLENLSVSNGVLATAF